jgi:hypothetical protein
MSDRIIKDYNKCILGDLKKQNDITAEINFSKEEDLADCVRLTVGGKSALIPVKELHSLVWMVVDSQQREEMTPVVQKNIRYVEGYHKIQAKKDIKKGEYIMARYQVPVEERVVQGLKGMIGGIAKKTFGSVPIIGK